MDTNEEIVRLLALGLRHRVESQAEAIQELNKIGFGPSRIADLLGTTANTVNVTLAKKRAAPAKAKEKP